jgi:hypothetical protein
MMISPREPNRTPSRACLRPGGVTAARRSDALAMFVGTRQLAAIDRQERSAYFRPPELGGVEALHATFVEHAYRPHSHATWTIAVVEAGAAEFSVETSQERAGAGELFVLEPDAVHTGMAAVPEGWTYKVLYLEPELVGQWADGDASMPRASRWVVFRDNELRGRLARAHAAFAAGERGIPSQCRSSKLSPVFTRICARFPKAVIAIVPNTPP